jgi:hypothetical protein
VQLFLQTLKDRSKEIPNLISPHLGDKVPTDWVVTPASSSAAPNNTKANDVFAALPVGGRIKVNPWNDQLRMAKYKPVGAVAEDEKRPLQITPLVPYLARPENGSPTESATGVPAESGPATP